MPKETNMKNKTTDIKESDIVSTLVGLRVLKMVEDGNRTHWNGLITGHIKDFVFIMLFDWMCGSPTHMICVKEEELTTSGRYKFFYTLEELDGYMDAYQKYHDEHYDKQKAKELEEK